MDPTTNIVNTNTNTKAVATDKPHGIPLPKQDFEKIMDDQKKSKQGQSGSQSFATNDEETAPLPSPFDLPKPHPKGNIGSVVTPTLPKKGSVTSQQKTFTLDDTPVEETPEQPVVVEEKPITPLKPLVAEKPLVKEMPETPVPVEVKTVTPVQGKISPKIAEKRADSKMQFSKEMPDLSQVNPLGAQLAAAPVVQGALFTDTPPIPRVDINKLIAEIVDSIQTMTNAGQTETTITLKGTPLLEGARVILTSFESAPKEFNVAFENLSPDAKRIMDAANNQQALVSGFKDNGMVLHIITTNTQIERPIYTGESSGSNFSREREDGGGREGQSKDKREQ